MNNTPEPAASAGLIEPPTYDFGNLTGNQRALLHLGGWRWTEDESRTEPENDTTHGLIKRGLLVVHHRRANKQSIVRREFEVPADVAAAWRVYIAGEIANPPVPPDPAEFVGPKSHQADPDRPSRFWKPPDA